MCSQFFRQKTKICYYYYYYWFSRFSACSISQKEWKEKEKKSIIIPFPSVYVCFCLVFLCALRSRRRRKIIRGPSFQPSSIALLLLLRYHFMVLATLLLWAFLRFLLPLQMEAKNKRREQKWSKKKCGRDGRKKGVLLSTSNRRRDCSRLVFASVCQAQTDKNGLLHWRNNGQKPASFFCHFYPEEVRKTIEFGWKVKEASLSEVPNNK